MNAADIQQFLKNLSGNELARIQNAALLSDELDDDCKFFLVSLIAQELSIRQNEGLGRKAERFWNRHGDSTVAKAALVGLGALIGIQLS